MVSLSITTLLLLVTVTFAWGQLVVNVKNKGGEVLQETILANISLDTIRLDFQEYDGTLIAQFIDIKNDVQIFKVLVLGEEERGQSQSQVMCFVTRFIKNEFISSDAMSKLRQKNPGATRHPEEDKGVESYQMDLMVDLSLAHLISPHIVQVCEDAADATYIRDMDLKLISTSVAGKDYMVMLGATKRTALLRVQNCRDTTELWRQCMCQFEICVGWYPCGLKYCRGKDSSGKVVSYRCGIKTCRKCRHFTYYTRQKANCLWDETDSMAPPPIRTV
ncbi:Out at first protein [Lamellibrachia satsuma]|nr:Out at first protein [Lamellibrachia satsuma]